MRFITLSALFLFASTTLAAPLALSSREEDTYSSLSLRDGVADTEAAIEITARSEFDDENWLERRVNTVKKAANKAARKQRKTTAKAEVSTARQKAMTKANPNKKVAKTPAGVAASHAAGKKAANNKKAELKTNAQAKHNAMKAAGAEHRKTTGLPGRNQNSLFQLVVANRHTHSLGRMSVKPTLDPISRTAVEIDSESHLPTTTTKTQDTQEPRSPSLVWLVQATSTHCPERRTMAK